MKHSLKIALSALISLIAFTNVNAYDFKVASNTDTIYYSKTQNPKIVFVTFKEVDKSSYTGDIVIPQEIEVEGKKYIVGGIGNSAFKNCNTLTSVSLPIGIEYIGDDAFRNCTALTKISLPEYVRKIGYYSFGNSGIKEIKIPAVKEVEGMAFKDCNSLKNVVMHDSIKVIGDFAFMNCYNLEKVNLPEAMERLGRSAFFNCVKMGEEVTISHKTKLVGLYAFGNCHSLKVVRCNGTAYIPYCEKFAFGDVRPINKTLIIAPGTKKGYSRIQEWQDFVNIIEE
jgi:hypothetical protein